MNVVGAYVDPIAVLDAVQAAVVVVDRDGIVVFANDVVAAMAGADPSDIVGTRFDDDRWRARDRTGRLLERGLHPLGRALAGEVVAGSELIAESAGGQTMVLMASARPLRDAEGVVTHAVATFQDVTEATGWEAQLEASQARFAAVFEHAVEAMLLFDDEGRYLQANPAAGRLLGRSPDELVGVHYRTVMADSSADEQGWSDFIRLGIKEDIVDLVRADGTVVTVAAQSVAGVEPGVNLTVWRDVTEQRRATEALEQAVLREREAVDEQTNIAAMKDVFLSAVSHELRTPMAAIAGFNDTLRAHAGRLDEDQARVLLARQHDNIRRLEELVEDLLDLDRLKRGLGIVEPVTVRLAEMVTDAVVEAAESTTRVCLELVDAEVTIDAAKVARIIGNLVSNALRHTPAGTRVVVRAGVVDDEVRLEVEDDGPGLPAGIRDQAFEMFVKGTGEHARRGGTGIGLGIVRQFARLMGGEAVHDVGELGGLRVRVTIPDLAAARDDADG